MSGDAHVSVTFGPGPYREPTDDRSDTQTAIVERNRLFYRERL